jgi:hypothetical protein
MKRMSLLFALIALTAGIAGCGCCNWWRPTTVAYPAPAPVCDPCTTAPVTYGPPPAVVPYTPPPQW